jgi:hypothetical protein
VSCIMVGCGPRMVYLVYLVGFIYLAGIAFSPVPRFIIPA